MKNSNLETSETNEKENRLKRSLEETSEKNDSGTFSSPLSKKRKTSKSVTNENKDEEKPTNSLSLRRRMRRTKSTDLIKSGSPKHEEEDLRLVSSQNFKKEETVLVKWIDNKFYEATIVEISKQNIKVLFADGTTEVVAKRDIMPLNEPKKDNSDSEDWDSISCSVCKKGTQENKLLICDICNLGFHTFCLKPSLQTIPDGAWACPKCMRKISSKITEICSYKEAIPFCDPVDPVKLDIPDYFDIIKHPMNFKTIQDKLNSNQYLNLDSVVHDLELIFSNCRTYNPSSSEIIFSCDYVENLVLKAFQNIFSLVYNSNEQDSEPQKKKRGRPFKQKKREGPKKIESLKELENSSRENVFSLIYNSNEQDSEPEKKKRGRPKELERSKELEKARPREMDRSKIIEKKEKPFKRNSKETKSIKENLKESKKKDKEKSIKSQSPKEKEKSSKKEMENFKESEKEGKGKLSKSQSPKSTEISKETLKVKLFKTSQNPKEFKKSPKSKNIETSQDKEKKVQTTHLELETEKKLLELKKKEEELAKKEQELAKREKELKLKERKTKKEQKEKHKKEKKSKEKKKEKSKVSGLEQKSEKEKQESNGEKREELNQEKKGNELNKTENDGNKQNDKTHKKEKSKKDKKEKEKKRKSLKRKASEIENTVEEKNGEKKQKTEGTVLKIHLNLKSSESPNKSSSTNSKNDSSKTSLAKQLSFDHILQSLPPRIKIPVQAEEELEVPNAPPPIDWTPEEDEALNKVKSSPKVSDWQQIAESLGGKYTPSQYFERWRYLIYPQYHNRVFPWTPEEDEFLVELGKKYGCNWTLIANNIIGRTDLACKRRWYVLKCATPKSANSVWSDADNERLIELHAQFGNSWTLLESYFPGRNANSIKNHWRSVNIKKDKEKKYKSDSLNGGDKKEEEENEDTEFMEEENEEKEEKKEEKKDQNKKEEKKKSKKEDKKQTNETKGKKAKKENKKEDKKKEKNRKEGESKKQKKDKTENIQNVFDFNEQDISSKIMQKSVKEPNSISETQTGNGNGSTAPQKQKKIILILDNKRKLESCHVLNEKSEPKPIPQDEEEINIEN